MVGSITKRQADPWPWWTSIFPKQPLILGSLTFGREANPVQVSRQLLGYVRLATRWQPDQGNAYRRLYHWRTSGRCAGGEKR